MGQRPHQGRRPGAGDAGGPGGVRVPVPELSRHADLGHFLRSRRQKLGPTDVDLPVRGRRRGPGLRREEIAALANVSPSWYTNLEQGRKVRPSVEVLDSLADALRLDHTNRIYLHALGAGQADSILPETGPDPDIVGRVDRLMVASQHVPYPIYVIDGLGNLLAWNDQMGDWYDDFAARRGRDRNLVWWMFTEPRARERIVNWDVDARELVARVRFFVGVSRSTVEVRTTVRDLYAESTEFATWWDDHEVLDQETRRRTFRHPHHGVRPLDLLVMRPAPNAAMSIVYHLPPPQTQTDPPA